MEPRVTRYYGLDALRACLLLLGVVLHLAIPYTGFPAPGFYATEERSAFLQVLIIVVHYFRMPAFFLLSGFFSCLLWERYGGVGFLRNRFRRIGVVWLVALCVLTPLVAPISIYIHFVQQHGEGLRKAIEAILLFQAQRAWLQSPPLHLWFLEYLMVFCVAAALAFPRFEHVGRSRWVQTALRSRFRFVFLAIPTALSLRAMPVAMARYPDSLIPAWDLLALYGPFYAIGWLFFYNRDAVSASFTTNARVEKWACPLAFVATLTLLQAKAKLGSSETAAALDLAVVLGLGIFVWSLVLAIFGVALRRNTPSYWTSYLADASYWVYLSHFPLTCLLPVLLRNWSAPAVVKVALSTAGILVVLLFAYERLVRYTALGRALNGRHLVTPAPAVRSRTMAAGQG